MDWVYNGPIFGFVSSAIDFECICVTQFKKTKTKREIFYLKNIEKDKRRYISTCLQLQIIFGNDKVFHTEAIAFFVRDTRG